MGVIIEDTIPITYHHFPSDSLKLPEFIRLTEEATWLPGFPGDFLLRESAESRAEMPTWMP